MSFNKIYEISGSALTANTIRLNTVSSNMANVDAVASSEQEAYRALKPVFETVYNDPSLRGKDQALSAKVSVKEIVQSDAAVQRRYEPDHPMANADGYVFYSNVNAIEETADMMASTRLFETNVEVMNQAKSMQQALLRLGDR